jgi:hypothetical protein
MALDFTTAALDPRVTVTRASNTATCFNASGFIETVNANLPRFDYNSLTLQCKGLLIEEARTNLFLYSNQFDQFPWAVGDATISVDTTISPLGVQNADTLTEAANNSVHFLFATSPLQPAGTYTYSIYVKPNGRTKFRLQQNDTVAYAVLFDLIAQTVTPIAGGATGVIEPVKDGWFRCSMTYVTTVPIFLTNVVYLANSGGSISYLGDGVSGLHLSAAQLELGAFATSYIPTVASQVTRNPDIVSMTGTNFSSWYNASEGALSFEGSILADQGATTVDFSQISDGVSNSNVISLGMFGVAFPFLQVINGTTQANIGLGTLTVGATFKMVGAYKLNSFAGALNGGAAATDVSGSIPTGMTQIGLGNRLSGAYMNGHARRFMYWPQRLTNAEVQAFSK